jgi:hypothetical protein
MKNIGVSKTLAHEKHRRQQTLAHEKHRCLQMLAQEKVGGDVCLPNC